MPLDIKELDSSLSSLRLTSSSASPSSSRPSINTASRKFTDEEPVADSWEEAASDDESSPITIPSHKRVDSSNLPNAPPPTPISPPPQGNPFAVPPPQSSTISDRFAGGGFSAAGERGVARSSSATTRDPERRQEKTDAVAKRLIAGALGIRAPKKTDEQRAYDRAIRENEMRKRNEEKEAAKRAEEEAAKAKAAVWED